MTAVATASPIPITAGTDCRRRCPTARTWLTTAPTDSSVSPTAAAMPSGGHAQPDQHANDSGQFERPMSRHGDRLDPEVVANRQRLPDAKQFDRTGEGEQSGQADRDDYRCDGHLVSVGAPREGSGRMIRCIRLWTGQEGASHVEIGRLDMRSGRNDDLVSGTMSAAHVTVEETAGGGALAWHTAPVRQLVVTLLGHSGSPPATARSSPCIPVTCCSPRTPRARVTSGSCSGTDPWRRMYVVLAPGADVAFVPD